MIKAGASQCILSKLGFSSTERVVVLHADDVGMCGATVAAYGEISARASVSSASVMVPCSWFPAVARLVRNGGEALDMGVHLTLTSEWSDYRWRPLTGGTAHGLCDSDGYFHATAAEVHQRATEAAVHEELRAQIERAVAAGIDITHLDTHMLVLWRPSLIRTYVRLAAEYGLPCFIARTSWPRSLERLESAERNRAVLFDAWTHLPLNDLTDRLEMAKRCLDALPAGLSYFLSHPAVDTPELRAIARDWEARVADYLLYMRDDWARTVENLGIKVVSMRALRSALCPGRELSCDAAGAELRGKHEASVL